jgi:hypothetical protein
MGPQLAVVAKDRTGAIRQKRFRQRRKLQKAEAVTRPVRAVTPLRSRRSILPVILLCAALAVASVSAGFSIVGLTAIFAASFWPIIGMGVALETAKLSAVAWLGRRYAAPRALKAGVMTLIVTLMGLNAIGCYGYLARAHIDRVVAGEAIVASHQAHVDVRRRLAAADVADLDRRIGQIDSAIAEATKHGRTTSAMSLAERQRGRRDALVAERTRAASALAAVEVESVGVENERAEQAVDFGPVEYLSKLIGIERDTAMRWFIVLVACLLDPAALMLLLAATRDSNFFRIGRRSFYRFGHP